jgi:hypothetical protein
VRGGIYAADVPHVRDGRFTARCNRYASHPAQLWGKIEDVMERTEQFKLQAASPDYPALQIALPLVSDHEGELRCVGTGFAVAPGLAITAAHVVDDWIEYQEERDGFKKFDSSFGVAALQFFEGKTWIWEVDAMYGSRVAHLAFLRFRRPSWWGEGEGKIRPRCARLSFNPPSVGEEIRVFGFPGSAVKDGVVIVTPAEYLGPSETIRDELAILRFSWYSVDLFELRKYAEWCREGYLPLNTVISASSNQLLFAVLEPCRSEGNQVTLPRGLDRFIESSRKFVQRLLKLDHES